MIEAWVIPAFRDAMPCRPQETGVLSIGDRIFGQGKGTYPYPVYRLFIGSTRIAPHEEGAFGYGNQLRLNHARKGLRTED
jgi:hypothetical protein